jgi:WD40 repeat protein
VLAVAQMNKLSIYQNGNESDACELKNIPESMAMSGQELIVSCNMETKRFNVNGGKLKEMGTIDIQGGAAAMKFNHNGDLLAVGDNTNKAIRLLEVNNGYNVKASNFPHSTRVKSIAWSPDDKYLASSCIDQSVAVWNTSAGKRKAVTKHGHRLSHVNSFLWLDNNNFVSGGQDGSLKVWEATF